MPDITVQLDIRNKQFGPLPGWSTTTAANGEPYSFKYSGGSDGDGDVDVDTPDQRIVVNLVCDQRYQIDTVSVTDPRGDLTPSHTGRQAILVDSDRDKGYDMHYGLVIRDTTANTTFQCDPEIHNRE